MLRMGLRAALGCRGGAPAAPRWALPGSGNARAAVVRPARPPGGPLPLARRAPDVAAAAGLQIGRPYSSKEAQQPASSFEELGLIPSLLEALKAAGFTAPTPIQSMAVRAILSGGDFLLASQTGSGKTLAYLLPLVHLLKGAEEAGEGNVRRPKRPKIVVLGPTKELTDQITDVSKSLCHFAKFKAVCCNANTRESVQAEKLAGPVDVVVATPTRLLQHQKSGAIALGDTRWLVVDEADTMFDQGFGEEVTQLLEALKSKPEPVQVVLVSATMTRAVKRLADAALPGLVRLEAPGFHCTSAGARQDFRVLPPGGDKLQMLLDLLQGDARRRRRVLVFCNSVSSCRAVEHACQDRDLPTVCYHGDMPIAGRKESMASFAGASAESPADAPCIMVATDLAARGLDFPGSIDHVVNFDFPSNAIDYLHRSGRTARAGATGQVTSLVGPRDRRLASAIQYALGKGLPLDQVTASGAQEQQQQQQPAKEEGGWKMPPRPKRVKGPAPTKGQKQVVAWNPEHKFLHLDKANGQPLVPFKELLKGKAGDERRRLLYEIAMDVKEWRRWRHARAVERAAKKRERRDAKGQEQWQPRQQGGRGGRGAAGAAWDDPEERWKQKVMAKRAKQAGRGGGGGGKGEPPSVSWQGRGRRGK